MTKEGNDWKSNKARFVIAHYLIGGKMRELEKHNPKIFNSDLVNLWSKTLRNNFNTLGRLLKQKLAIAFRLLLNGFWVLKSPQTLLYIKWWQQSHNAVHNALMWNSVQYCSLTQYIKFVEVKPFSNPNNLWLHKYGWFMINWSSSL